jgi:hypothetical protein
MSKKIEELRKIVEVIYNEGYDDGWHSCGSVFKPDPVEEFIKQILSWHNKHQRELDKEKVKNAIEYQVFHKLGYRIPRLVGVIAESLCNADVWEE